MPAARRVVVTGLGCVSPLGPDVQSLAEGLVQGRSGVRLLTAPWMNRDELKTWIGAPVEGFDLTERGFTAKDVRAVDRASCLAIAAAQEALRSAGIPLRRLEDAETRFAPDGVDPERFATVVGSGVGGLSTFEACHEQWSHQHTFRGTGFLKMALPMLIPNAPAANVAIRFGLRGECSAAPTACAAGTMSIGDAWRLIVAGHADAAVAGGADGVLGDHDGLGMAGFNNLRVMSVRNDDPPGASRPFDRGRDGFVLGEGAAMLVLEEEEHAKARGAAVLARVLGYACTCDAHSMIQPDPEGRMVQRAFELALASSDLSPRDVGYVNAHATSTLAGDRVEASVIRRVFGGTQPAVSATKSMTGHCIGASGGIEAVATVLGLRNGLLHETLNLHDVDAGCELDHVVGAPRRADVRVALSASYGFGGHDAVIAFGKA